MKGLRIFILAGVGCATVSAHAANPFSILGDFDTLIFSNLNGNSGSVEGRLAVGGNLTTPGGYSVGDKAPDDTTKNSLVVNGLLHAPNHWQVFSGNARYGSGTQLPTMEAGFNIQQQSGVYDFNAAKANLTSWSTFFANLAENGTELDQYTTYTLTGSDPTLNVFTVDAAGWAAASNRVIHAPSGSTVIVNVPGVTASMANGMQADSWLHNFATKQTRVLFNFADATTLNISNMQVLGSVLAPNANLTINGGSISGLAVLNSATQLNGGGFQRWDWQGSTPVPEPATLAILGLGAMTLIRRRKASARK